MENAKCLKQSGLDRLRLNIAQNLDRYQSADPWLAGYFGRETWDWNSNKVQAPSISLSLPKGVADISSSDLENTRVIYGSLKHWSPLQAADPRLWAYLTHDTYWHYMRARWPLEAYRRRYPSKDASSFIRDRYLFSSNSSRALVRNGLARLWWFGYASYDERRSDPFELTAVLLKKTDVAQAILERSFSLNPLVTRTLLEAMLERERNGKPFYIRDRVRDLAGHLIRIGGVTILDALDATELRRDIDAKIEQLEAA